MYQNITNYINLLRHDVERPALASDVAEGRAFLLWHKEKRRADGPLPQD